MAMTFVSKLVESATTTATKPKTEQEHFNQSVSTRRFSTPSPLPCKLNIDSPSCLFEDTFKKFDRTFWVRSNNYALTPYKYFPCWMSKSNAKKINNKKAPDGVVKVFIKNKPNTFDGEVVPFSCGQITSKKGFGMGCYEAVMQPSLVFG